jgi:hypothetical protein
MGALLFLEYGVPNPVIRQALLEQAAALASAYRGRLCLIGHERKEDDRDREIMVIELESSDDASAFATRCRADPRFSRTVVARIMTREPISQTEPLSPLFP